VEVELAEDCSGVLDDVDRFGRALVPGKVEGALQGGGGAGVTRPGGRVCDEQLVRHVPSDPQNVDYIRLRSRRKCWDAAESIP